MKKIYLDYNIILKMKKDDEFKKNILKYKKYFKFFYSPAHIEEIFKAKKMEYKNEIPELLELLNELTDACELLPSFGIRIGLYSSIREKKGIIEIEERAEECYKRVKEEDTTKKIEEFSKIYLHHRGIAEIKEISNYLPEKLFKNREVKKKLRKFSKKNNIPIYNYEKKYEKIYLDYNMLELVIELLFHFLNEINYSANRDEIESLSGIYDNTHCCYATRCNLFITTDYRFYRKCKAIYSFLGIKTKIEYITYEEIEKIFKILDNEKSK